MNKSSKNSAPAPTLDDLDENPELTKMIETAVNIVTIQKTVNDVQAGLDWLEKSISGEMDQVLAVFDEMVEFKNSFIRFRWWGGGEDPIDVSNAKIELVDTLHFLINHMLCEEDATVESVAAQLAHAAINVDASDADPALAASYFKQFLGYLLLENTSQVDLNAFFNLCGCVGMTWDHLALYYLGKSTLNKFRSQNGYSEKPRRYVKNWYGGQEDNYYLMGYIDHSIDGGVTLTVEDIRVWLEEQYRGVLASKGKA